MKQDSLSSPISLVLLLFVTSLLVPGDCYSAVQSTAEQACTSATTTADMLNCANARYAKAQAYLASVLVKLSRELDATAKLKLNNAQAAWLEYRKANADFEADHTARGGTMMPLIRTQVLTEMTQARAAQLEKALQTR